MMRIGEVPQNTAAKVALNRKVQVVASRDVSGFPSGGHAQQHRTSCLRCYKYRLKNTFDWQMFQETLALV